VTNLATIQPEPSTLPTVATPAHLLQMAVSQGADLDKLERLMALQERYEANEARKAFHAALAAFKAEPLTISKDKLVSIRHKDGQGKTEYTHATLGNVVAMIAPALGRYDLSHNWNVRREGDRVFVSCKLTHALGHCEEVTLDGPLDTSGSKNNIQAVGSTITYLQRYTLLAITGLATEDADDDGQSAERPQEDNAAAAKRNEWLEAITAAPTAPALDKVKADCIAAYGMADKVPTALKAAFRSRAKEMAA
jgi:hypothetical protein